MLTRRNFMAAIGGAAVGGFVLERSQVLAAVPKAITELGKVKIRDVKTASVKLTYYSANLVKVTTDSGLYGLGKAYRGAGTVNWIHNIKGEVIGEDPLQVDYLFQKMMEAGSGADARSGTLKDGYLELPNKPGLGVELNEKVCRKHLAEGSGFFD